LGAIPTGGGGGGLFGGAPPGALSGGLNGALPPVSSGGGLFGAPGLAASTAPAVGGALLGTPSAPGGGGAGLLGHPASAASSAGEPLSGNAPFGVAHAAITPCGVPQAVVGTRPSGSSGAPFPLAAPSLAALTPHTRFASLPATTQADLLTVERHLRDQWTKAVRLAMAATHHDAAAWEVIWTTRRVGRAVTTASAAVDDGRAAVRAAAGAAAGERSAAERVIPTLTASVGKAARAADAAAERDLEVHWVAAGMVLAERAATYTAAVAGLREVVAVARARVYGGGGAGATRRAQGGRGTPPLPVDAAAHVEAAIRAQVARLMGAAAATATACEDVDALRGSWLGVLRRRAERGGAASDRGGLCTHVVDPFLLAAGREAADERRCATKADAVVVAAVAVADTAPGAGVSTISPAAAPPTSTAAVSSVAGGGGMYGGGGGVLRIRLGAPTTAAPATSVGGLWGAPPAAAAAEHSSGGLFGSTSALAARTAAAGGGGGLFGVPADVARAASTSAAVPVGGSSLFGRATGMLSSHALGMGIAASAPAPSGGGGLFDGSGFSLGVGSGAAVVAPTLDVPPGPASLPPLQLGGSFGTAAGGLDGVPSTPVPTTSVKRRTFVGGGGSRRKR